MARVTHTKRGYFYQDLALEMYRGVHLSGNTNISWGEPCSFAPVSLTVADVAEAGSES